MKRVTLKDIAKIAHVSVTTVSKALADHPDVSDKTKARIRQICQEEKYVPNANASFLRSNNSNLIAMVVSDNTNPFFGELLKIIERELAKQDYCVFLFNTNEDEKTELRAIRKILSMNVAGVIITPVSAKSVQMLEEFDIPFVMACDYIDKDKGNYVVPDDIHAGYIATKKIIGSTPETPLFFLGPQRSFSGFQNRLSGYFQALDELGIPVDRNQIISEVFNSEDGYAAAQAIVTQHKPPYSFICDYDFIAIGVLKLLNEKNIAIPEQAKIVSFDNLNIFSYSNPTLTTVDTQNDQIGILCVKTLLDIIGAKNRGETPEDARIVLPVKLIENKTC